MSTPASPSTLSATTIGSSSLGDIVVVGLNAALQKRFILSSGPSSSSSNNNNKLIPGNVHRATRIDTGIGGKGQDVAITLNCLLSNQQQQIVQLCQFVGGRIDNNIQNGNSDESSSAATDAAAGRSLYGLLMNRLGLASIENLTVRTMSPTRTCTSIVATDETTELVEPSGVIQTNEIEEMFQRLEDRYGGGDSKKPAEEAATATSTSESQSLSPSRLQTKERIRALCIMGSMPPGVPDDMYGQIFTKLFHCNNSNDTKNTCVVVDSVVGITELLTAISRWMEKNGEELPLRRHRSPNVILKINASELCKLTGVTKHKSETGGVQQTELQEAIRSFVSRYHELSILAALIGIAITDGKHPAYLVEFQDHPEQQEESQQQEQQQAEQHDQEDENIMYKLYKLPIPSLDTMTKTLYPIGAGDAVAGGMLAAWTTLFHTAGKNDEEEEQEEKRIAYTQGSVIRDDMTKELQRIHGKHHQSMTFVTTAFAFGLCCGSASCLQEENSALDTEDVTNLLRQYRDIEFVGTFSAKRKSC